MGREGEEVGQGQEWAGLECLSKVFGLESKGRRFKQGRDCIQGITGLTERREVDWGPKGAGSCLGVCHDGQVGTRPEPGPWRGSCNTGPLWKCTSEVNGQGLVDSEGRGQ